MICAHHITVINALSRITIAIEYFIADLGKIIFSRRTGWIVWLSGPQCILIQLNTIIDNFPKDAAVQSLPAASSYHNPQWLRSAGRPCTGEITVSNRIQTNTSVEAFRNPDIYLPPFKDFAFFWS